MSPRRSAKLRILSSFRAAFSGTDLEKISYTCPPCAPKAKPKLIGAKPGARNQHTPIHRPPPVIDPSIAVGLACPPCTRHTSRLVSALARSPLRESRGTQRERRAACIALQGGKGDQPVSPSEMQYAIDDEPWETIHTPMPLRLGSLTIIDLGRIEFTKPRFHDTNYIWPVGFTSTRVYVGPCLAL